MSKRNYRTGRIFLAALIFLSSFPAAASPQESFVPAFAIERDEMTLERPARPNTYFDKVGLRFAILGLESGTFEAWAYPLKLLRNFEFSFLLRNSTRPIPGKDIVRFIEVAPAATTLTYTYQSFTVKAHFITAITEPGAVILLEVDAIEPLTIVAGFLPVLQPMWPAGMGGQYAAWDEKLRAYLISEPTRKNHGFVGSPAAQGISYTPAHMLSDTPSEFTIAVEKPEEVEGKFIPIILAGGKGKREDIRTIYEKLASDPKAVYLAAFEHYRNLRQNTLRVRTPCQKLNLALEWAKVSYDNLRVDNPDLGKGLVAGLGLSGTGGRPGFGWFFGTDAYLNSLSLTSFGAFDATKEALAFTQKRQRKDGKMAHELSQAAGYIDWFKDYPYGYIHGDTTPWYIAAMYDYYLWSGDREFLKQIWPSLRRAYEWCLGTDADGDGLMDNSKAGLGALEFGSLTGIQTDIYLAAVWLRAVQSMEQLAHAMGEGGEFLVGGRAGDYLKGLETFNARFWDAENGQYSYAFNADGKQVKELTPWCAVPLMWKIGEDERAALTLEKMSSSELTADWGVRILTTKSSLYEPLNYNYGAVWPFLTGYLALAQYKHNNYLQGYQALMSNADHVFDNALGHVTELFSGAQHIWPQEAVAHQGFSVGGFVLPFIRGMLGLEAGVVGGTIMFEPRFPADWTEVMIENFRLGNETLSFLFRREKTKIRLEVVSRPGNRVRVIFDPALGLGTKILKATWNGKPREFDLLDSPRIVQPSVWFDPSGRDVVEIEFEPTVEILPPLTESRVGDFDKGLKIIRLDLEGKNLRIIVEGLAGRPYGLGVLNADLVEAVEGAELQDSKLLIEMPAGKEREFLRKDIVIKIK